jgi:hypothetical protein
MVFAAALSGCVGDKKDAANATGSDGTTPSVGDPTATDGSGDPTSSGGSGDPTSTSGTGAPNLPPSAVASATPVEGADYTFIFDGANSTDPEGAPLLFSWDFGDGTTSPNATETHTFDLAGFTGAVSFNVTLAVTDDAGNTDLETLVVNMTAGPAPGTPLGKVTKTFTGTVTQPVAEVFCGDSPAGMDDLQFYWDLPQTTSEGYAYKISHFKIALTGSATNVDSDLYFYDAANQELGHQADLDSVETVDVNGGWDPQIFRISVIACFAVAGTATVNAEADLVAA